MASTDARPVPQKNVAYRVTFPIMDADGDLVTGATGLDSEVSKDGGTFADCTNEATEIATASGMYFLDLSSTEMNADTVAIIVKTTSSGAKTTPIVLYPEEAGDIRANLTQWLGSAPNALVSSRVDVSVGAMAADVVTAAAIAPNAIGASELAADAVTKIADETLKRDWNSVTGEAARCLLNANRKLRNRTRVNGGNLEVYKEDGTTVAYTQPVTPDAAAVPIKELGT